MQSFLRFVQLLTIVIWVGGLIFFAFVLAPTAFHTLPTIHLAGLVVGESLRGFDILALGSGAMFLLATGFLFRTAPHRLQGRYELEFLLAAIMLLGTAYLQYNILPAMDADQSLAAGDIASTPANFPAHKHFDKLHIRSERIAGAILFLGLAVVFLISREQLPLDPPLTTHKDV